MSEATYFPIGASVYFEPKQPAPDATDENQTPEVPPRAYGEVRGIQALEPPVSYLVKKADGSTEWLPEEKLELVTDVSGSENQAAA